MGGAGRAGGGWGRRGAVCLGDWRCGNQPRFFLFCRLENDPRVLKYCEGSPAKRHLQKLPRLFPRENPANPPNKPPAAIPQARDGRQSAIGPGYAGAICGGGAPYFAGGAPRFSKSFAALPSRRGGTHSEPSWSLNRAGGGQGMTRCRFAAGDRWPVTGGR